jgi:hypothetical protein
MQETFIKKCFLFTVGSVCHAKQFTTGWQTEVSKWLRQQSKDFYAAGLGTLVKRWGKCVSVGGGYVEK